MVVRVPQVVAAVLSVGVVGALCAVAPAAAAPRSAGSLSTAELPGHATLRAVSARAPDDVWAVGTSPIKASQSLIEHWNGSTWHRFPSPDPGGTNGSTSLSGVAALSATDVWAVGAFSIHGRTNTLTLHFDGTSWHRVASPNPGNMRFSQLMSVSGTSSTDVWAVGLHVTTSGVRTLAEHWDGTSWKKVACPGGPTSVFRDVSALSGTDAWAVGATGPDVLIEHWDGTRWQVVASPNPGLTKGGELEGVSALSTTDVWATGEYGVDTGQLTLVEHWDGTSWQQVPSPPGTPMSAVSLQSVTAISSTDVWAVGYTLDTINDVLLEHWDGQQWTQVAGVNPGDKSNQLFGVSAVSPTNVWAVGSAKVGGVVEPVVEHWNGASWTLGGGSVKPLPR